MSASDAKDAKKMESDMKLGTVKAGDPLDHGSRKFYSIEFTKSEDEHHIEGLERNLPTSAQEMVSLSDQQLASHSQDLLKYIHNNIIGNDTVFVGPFGRRKVEYCDYTASGRSLSFIEDYIRQNVLSHYGNTHTMTSVSSLQTTLFRHEARDIIRNSVNAGEHDCVLFEGSGSTGAIHKLIHVLDLQEPPVVIVSPFEHHSNLLPWREMGVKVIRVHETRDGEMDMDHLDDILKSTYRCRKQIICAFSAASNITGILVNVNEVTVLCHKYNALVMWDYASAAPYVHIDMNPVISGINPDLVAKDAVFISTHKFVGGVQTPGILIAKKRLFKNQVPYIPGGGTVFFVRRDAQRYLKETELREEGGTPAIVESIRAGLVFQLKEAVGTNVIMAREEQFVRQAFDFWKNCSNLLLLGSKQAPRLAVFSFMVQHQQTGLYLHHNYVSALLNDLFGIQARGGCACAGPYAEDLLGIDEELAKCYEDLLLEESQLNRDHLRRQGEYSHHEILRPGFVRLNLAYFLDDETVQFILEAVSLVAEHGWKLLPQYNFNPETGEWRHKDHQIFRDRVWLGHVSYKNGCMTYKLPNEARWVGKTKEPPNGHKDCLQQAQDIFKKAEKLQIHLPDHADMFDEESKKLRWFLLPSEAMLCLHGHCDLVTAKDLPYRVVCYPRKSAPYKKGKCPVQDPVEQSKASSARKSCLSCSSTYTEVRTFQEGFVEFLKEEHHKLRSDELLGDKIKVDVVQNEKQQPEVPSVPLDQDAATRSDETASGSNVAEHDGAFLKQDENSTVENVKKDIQSEDSPVELLSASNNEPGTKLAAKRSEIVDDKKKTDDRNSSKDMDTKQKKIDQTSGHKWHPPPKSIFKPFVQALEEFSMIKDGDRVLVCLSGGKDSLSLLHSLHQYQFYSKSKGIRFELGAVTIDPQTSSYDPRPLRDYLAELGVPYFYEEQCILDTAQNLPYECASICSFCSRMKRGRIYHTARRENYNVLALGQHLDDLAESFLMSLFYNGTLRTMKACYSVDEGDLRVIRPFVYVREVDLRIFAEENTLPVITENCPACFEAPKERQRMKQLLASQEILHPRLFSSILSAMKPIFSINRTGIDLKGLLNDQYGKAHEDTLDIDQV